MRLWGPHARAVFLAFFFVHISFAAAPPSPKEHLGHEVGEDYKIADFTAIRTYFEKLAGASDRIRLEQFGTSAGGRPLLVAFISAPENLRQLERYRQISRRLTLGQATAAEAKALALEGKAIVWIDSGLHASEVACAQHSPELAYRMLTEESEEVRRIRQNVILMQVPVINPDGLDMVAKWNSEIVGTPHERAPLPYLYQKYAGHDNNRDWFMLNLTETRHVTRLLFQEWFPQIVYNQHQTATFPARIFIPPYAEPLNPNIQPSLMEGINLIGAAMKERLAREKKSGALSYYGFDAWWNGGLRSVPAFHNMHGILTETAGNSWAAPRTYAAKDLPDVFPNGIPTKEPSVFYERPWMGGRWTFRDAIDYMLSCDFAILEFAAARSRQFLEKAWELALVNIEAGKKQAPYAYVVPMNERQRDRFTAVSMVERLQAAGIEVQAAKAAFRIQERTYPAGTLVMLAAQPFRGYLVDLMEPQKYPEIRGGAQGSLKRPYDVAGWTLPLQMGVAVERVDDRFEAALAVAGPLKLPEPRWDHRDNSSFLATADALARGAKVRWSKTGAILREGDPGFARAAYELQRPRVAIYQPWPELMDAGWTMHALDSFGVPYTVVRNEDFQSATLRARFDTIILAQQSAEQILHGTKDGELGSRRVGELPVLPKPEFTGGIGVAGLARLEEFVRQGGTLIALDHATELPLQFFATGTRGVLKAREAAAEDDPTGYYCPGSLLRIDVDTTHPINFGMPSQAIAMSTGGQAFDITVLPEFNQNDREVRSLAKYASTNLLASGWLAGERVVQGKSIAVESRLGKGRVVMFGFRPQFRGQSHGTYKMLLNAVYWGSATPLE